MHLTGLMIYCPAPHMIMSWVYPREKIRHQWSEIEYWAEIAQTLERGKMDMFFFADGWGGGGGFQITPSYYAPDYFADLNQTPIPVLQKRGLFRKENNGATLRDYMNEDAPVLAAPSSA